MDRPRLGSFTPFLEERARLEKSEAADVSPIRLLTLLSQSGGAMSTADLMQASGMPISSFAEALQTVRIAGFVQVGGDPEAARLTDKGKDIAALTNAA